MSVTNPAVIFPWPQVLVLLLQAQHMVEHGGAESPTVPFKDGCEPLLMVKATKEAMWATDKVRMQTVLLTSGVRL